MNPTAPPRRLPLRARAAALLLGLAALAAPAVRAQELPPELQPKRPVIRLHVLSVELDPAAGRVRATDSMGVDRGAGGGGDLVFDLSDRLALESVKVANETRDAVGLEPAAPAPGILRYRVPVGMGPGLVTVTVTYSGVLREEARKEGGAGFVIGDRTRGTISPEGVFLSESTGWVPSDGGVASYALLSVTVPAGWSVVTQGPRSSLADLAALADSGAAGFRYSFEPSPPSDGLWLQAGKWKVEHRATKSGVRLGTFLSEANAPHAKLLLDAAEADLEKYEALLGPYPHRKFDIVENFFTSGYGMPGATLLGGDVIARMAQAASHGGGKIPAGYLDHEIVHGWWGNGVLVDYATGNWCEALTTYCTNYLRKEWESPEAAAEHRRAVRAKFAARVPPGKDYPLRKFTGKTEDFENDIGYGKGSLLFHAVRGEIGDDAFFGALRDMASRAGTRASWDHFRDAFERRSKRNLESLFRAFLDLPGAPVVALEGFAVAPAGDRWEVRGEVVNRGRPWPLSAELVVETTRGEVRTRVDLSRERVAVGIATDALPVRVLLDPASHGWRGFVAGEEPPTLDATLRHPAGTDAVLAADDAAALAPLREALAAQPGIAFAKETDAPRDGAAILVAGIPRPGSAVESILRDPGCPVRLGSDGGLVAGGQTFRGDDVAVLASYRSVAGVPVTAYVGFSPAAFAAARRVFYYGADGVVVFRAGRPALRLPPTGDASSRTALLGDRALPGADAARVETGLLESLPGGAAHGRGAGSKEGEAFAALLAKRLKEEDGHAVVLQPFAVALGPAWSGEPCLFLGENPYDPPGVPFCFSGGAKEPVQVRDAALVHVKADTTAADALASIREAAARGVPAVLVLGPEEPPAALADYLLHAGALPDAEKRRLEERAAKGGSADASMHVAGKRARLLAASERLDVPVVYLGQRPERSALPSRLAVTPAIELLESVNVFAVIPGTDPALAGEPVLLGCHHDGMGEGFAGADDDLSGVLALREAGRILKGQANLLRRPVVLAFFGAEEWGLRGSRAFAAAPPAGVPRPVAALTLDTVGDRAAREVFTVGVSVHPALAAAASRCVEGAGLPAAARDIDRFAFAHGSDHYALHEAGIPAVDWFSGDYSRMHTRGDVAERVDASKIAALARAAAAFALDVSRGGVPR